MVNPKILTPVQVAELRVQILQGNLSPLALQDLLLESLACHEALRAQLTAALRGLEDANTEREMEKAYRQDVQKGLAEAQADVRVLAERIKGVLDYYGNGRVQPTAYQNARQALARPGVLKALGKKPR